jgi:hypothetical protein
MKMDSSREKLFRRERGVRVMECSGEALPTIRFIPAIR